MLVDYGVIFGLYDTSTPPKLLTQIADGQFVVAPIKGNLGAIVYRFDNAPLTTEDFDKVTFYTASDPTGQPQGWNAPDGVMQPTAYFMFERPNGTDLKTGIYPLTFRTFKTGQMVYEAKASVTLSVAIPAPVAPTQLTAVRNPSLTGVVLAYKDNSNNEAGFEIEWQKPNGTWSQFDTAGANVTGKTVLVNPLPDGTKFRVAAVNNGGRSAWSNEATIPVTAVIPAPATISASQDLHKVLIRWNFEGNNWDGPFTIERSTNSGAFNKLVDVSAGVLNYIDASVVIGSTYTYRVKAFNAITGQTSANSIPATVGPIF